MGLCILLLEPHVSGSHKTPAQTKGMADNLLQHGCHGEASKVKGEPIYSAVSHVHSWGVSGAWKGFVHQWNLFFFLYSSCIFNLTQIEMFAHLT